MSRRRPTSGVGRFPKCCRPFPEVDGARRERAERSARRDAASGSVASQTPARAPPASEPVNVTVSGVAVPSGPPSITAPMPRDRGLTVPAAGAPPGHWYWMYSGSGVSASTSRGFIIGKPSFVSLW